MDKKADYVKNIITHFDLDTNSKTRLKYNISVFKVDFFFYGLAFYAMILNLFNFY